MRTSGPGWSWRVCNSSSEGVRERAPPNKPNLRHDAALRRVKLRENRRPIPFGGAELREPVGFEARTFFVEDGASFHEVEVAFSLTGLATIAPNLACTTYANKAYAQQLYGNIAMPERPGLCRRGGWHHC